MAIMTTAAIVKLALSTVNGAISLYKKKVPSWEQSEAKKLFNRQEYLEALYEIEKTKPRYDESKTPEENKNARSTDKLLNLRDAVMLNGKKTINRLGQL